MIIGSLVFKIKLKCFVKFKQKDLKNKNQTIDIKNNFSFNSFN